MKLASGSSIINPLDAKQCHRKTDNTSSKYEYLKTTIGIHVTKTHQHQHNFFRCGNFTSSQLVTHKALIMHRDNFINFQTLIGKEWGKW
jgi:hypothetical protein